VEITCLLYCAFSDRRNRQQRGVFLIVPNFVPT